MELKSHPGALLSIQELKTHFTTRRGVAKAVDGVSLDVMPNSTLGIVGESGSGKTVTCLSVMNLLPGAGKIAGGKILFQGRDLAQCSEAEYRSIRGREIGMVFQDPMTSLNPFLTIGDQVAEPITVHEGCTQREARSRAIQMLDLVGIPEAERRYGDHPHRFSGGMRQRVMIAMSLVSKPKLLIADEPTTALDVTIQAQVLEIFRKTKEELGTSIVLVTHNLGIVAGLADYVAVMYAGRVVEYAPVNDLFASPRHPYTIALLKTVPRIDAPEANVQPIPGLPPDLARMPAGCAFRDRCAFRVARCVTESPVLAQIAGDHKVSCWVDASQGAR